ncbi:MAG: hypothetical protein ABFS05_08000 [Bacteroidota bacterium]
MKKLFPITWILILSFSVTQINAQEEMQYLFGGTDNNVSISGFAGVFHEFSSINNEFAFSMGGGGALLINKKFFLGGYGLGLTTQHYWMFPKDVKPTIHDNYTRFGHGGFWLGYIYKPHKVIHFSVNTKLGWGTVSLTDKLYRDPSDRWESMMYDNVFVITPELAVGLNLFKWMRLNAAVGYRFVSGVDKSYIYKIDEVFYEKAYFESDAFNSVTGNITLAFGWFNK